jgi:hypothetical protein
MEFLLYARVLMYIIFIATLHGKKYAFHFTIEEGEPQKTQTA